jgi:hypothetical protein
MPLELPPTPNTQNFSNRQCAAMIGFDPWQEFPFDRGGMLYPRVCSLLRLE